MTIQLFTLKTLQHLKLGKLKFGIHKIGCSMSWTRYMCSTLNSWIGKVVVSFFDVTNRLEMVVKWSVTTIMGRTPYVCQNKNSSEKFNCRRSGKAHCSYKTTDFQKLKVKNWTYSGSPAIEFSEMVLFMHIKVEKSTKRPSFSTIFDTKNSFLKKCFNWFFWHQNLFLYVSFDWKMEAISNDFQALRMQCYVLPKITLWL